MFTHASNKIPTVDQIMFGAAANTSSIISQDLELSGSYLVQLGSSSDSMNHELQIKFKSFSIAVYFERLTQWGHLSYKQIYPKAKYHFGENLNEYEHESA